MIKVFNEYTNKIVVLDITRKDIGSAIFHGEAEIKGTAFIDVDNADVLVHTDEVTNKTHIKIEV